MEIKKVGNSSLFNLLEQGGLMSNEIYYHRHCYNNMVQNCEKLETDESIMDVKWKKGSYFQEHGKSYLRCRDREPRLIRGLNSMYVEQLQIHGIQEKVNTIRLQKGERKGYLNCI